MKFVILVTIVNKKKYLVICAFTNRIFVTVIVIYPATIEQIIFHDPTLPCYTTSINLSLKNQQQFSDLTT